MHLAEIAIALAAKIQWMQALSLDDDDYDIRSHLTDSLIGGGNPGISRIYDSIAAILVSQSRHEHIAATMQFHHPRRAILLLANNQPFDAPKTHSYLEKVWELLRDLSRAFSAVRSLQEPPTADRDRAASFFHALHDQRVSPLIHDLKLLIYSHAIEKFHRRVDKRWEGFQALTKALKDIINNAEVPQAEPNMKYLNFVRVSEFLEFLRDRAVDKDFFIRIVDGFNAAAVEIPSEQLDEWSTLVYWHHPGERGRFPLRKYLDKIKDLNRHIHALIGYAHSPHLRHYFNMELFIKLDIPHEEYEISIPRSVSQWSIVAESILDPVNLDLTDPDIVLQRVMFGYSNTKDPVPASVHSEVRLLHYIQSIGTATGQIYIGLNRPSCMGCHFYVRNHNQRHPEGYVSTRDPHDKYVFPWNLPAGMGVDFREDIFRCVAEDLRERFVMFGFTKARVG
ncbi:hypothetical protein M413DRAFT_449789 [Hebeloma cylindrosporum]|uniref:Uncharacterized protein n=1 Tax=Hebeloma cylindrosporum TaxID=76867 RepID=A0A0C3BF49_HEBCY|nr:hypothetical protein M413DRAFT_449789 [Hebeloma cylindrosporum h7]